MKTLILIPTRNESKTIGNVVKELKNTVECDILVVDDASYDHTIINAKEAGAVVLPLSIQTGAWGAIRAGFRYSLSRPYEYVITMDADGQHVAESIPDLLREIKSSGADVVVGSAIQRGSSYKKMAWYILRKLARLKIMDVTSGLRVYNRTAVESLLIDETALLTYQDIGVLLALKNNGFKLSEISVHMADRINGHSQIFHSWIAILRYFVFTFTLCMTHIGRNAK
ncbi:MAG: glycosyltransferase family 2 protein [Candidatus Magnetomorum sp.]|nr:glycosyltransferase family 2 protein [Candidatus Magnetomorum sp.]